MSVEQVVIPPDGGLITRFPSNQTWRRNYSGLARAVNVRAAAGRLYNAPGYEGIAFFPHLTTGPTLITDLELVQGEFHVLGDCSSLYAVTAGNAPKVYGGLGGIVAGLSFTFFDAVAMGYLGNTLGVTWSLTSGPGTASFNDPGAINATATVTLPGLYTFQLSGTDGITTVTASAVVRFITCTASPNYTFPSSTGGTLALTGTILGVSNPSDPLSDGSSYVWSRVSGPGTVTFDDPTNLTPHAVFPATPGDYVLALTVSVGATSYAAPITVTVPAITHVLTVTVGAPQSFVTFPIGSPRHNYTNPMYLAIDGGAPFLAVPGTQYPVSHSVVATADWMANPSISMAQVFQAITFTRTSGNWKLKAGSHASINFAAGSELLSASPTPLLNQLDTAHGAGLTPTTATDIDFSSVGGFSLAWIYPLAGAGGTYHLIYSGTFNVEAI